MYKDKHYVMKKDTVYEDDTSHVSVVSNNTIARNVKKN